MAFLAAAGAEGAGAAAAGRAGAARAGGARAGGARAARGPGSAGRSYGPGTVEQQKADIQKIKDARAPEVAPDPAAKPEPATVRVERSAASSGAGAVLGVFVWALVVNYLRGGVPQVRGFVRAKFLNQVTTAN